MNGQMVVDKPYGTIGQVLRCTAHSRLQCTCSPACDRSHFGDVHDSLVSPHISHAAQVGILEGLLGVGHRLLVSALTLGSRTMLLQQARQVLTLLPGHL